MDTSRLKKFAQFARRSLIEQVGSKLIQVLKEESPARRELPQVVATLEAELKSKGKEQLIEQVAYIWFNRFCALRFMDVNGYNRIGVLSPAQGQFQPEILAEAKAGHIDESVVNDATREKIFGLLNGTVKSHDGQSEAYRLLIVSVCNDYYRLMPYLFERIEDYTELLMPDDLLSGNSILAYTREAMTPEACESVECIGWLYQFYISEKKDKVFEALKNNKKITPENIPAATQLFTPHWIVRYLVENSLGRLWMLNNPNSKVIEQMDYYIKPIDEEKDFLKISSPEEIKICDPACGSGHMLTYAYDLLYAIYLDAGYDPVDIPELILTKNLYGIEIDERAAELAAFALSMKALKGNPSDDSNNRRRFFRNPIKPNICRLESVSFKDEELDEYIEFVGQDLFTQDLRATLEEFKEADNFGSLIQPTLKNAEDVLTILEAKDVSGQLFLTETHNRVLRVIKQADYLAQKYSVVVANPPYMGKKNMNKPLQDWATKTYPDTCADFFAMFIDRCLSLGAKGASISMITMDSWMSGDEYTEFRMRLLADTKTASLLHLGAHAFEEIKGEVVQVAAFVMESKTSPGNQRCFIDLTSEKSSSAKQEALLKGKNRYHIDTKLFEDLPRCVYAYFISNHTLSVFREGMELKEIAEAFTGLQTGDNDMFMRKWFELSYDRIFFERNPEVENFPTEHKWFPYVKGSDYRKWYGNNEFVLNWQNDGQEIKETDGSRPQNQNYYFREGIAYNTISNRLSTRFVENGFIFDQKNSMFFAKCEEDIYFTMAFLHSKVTVPLLRVVAPKGFGPGSMKVLPVLKNYENLFVVNKLARRAIEIAKQDWDDYEISWSFATTPLLSIVDENMRISEVYAGLCQLWSARVSELREIETQINDVFIKAYGLGNDLTADVGTDEITLNCNIDFRYSSLHMEERKSKQKSDAIADFVSYAVGCILGRFSPDISGGILVNQSQSLEDYLNKVPQPSFIPDDDNVVPMIDFEGDWFEDDISERFKQFLKVTFGEDNFAENLAFVEEAIGKDIKKYFTKDFYADHVKRYKKRPIYWLFSSPKGTFNALIYMHRYRPDTVSVVLNDYLREFRTKLQARKESYEQIEISASASQKEKTRAIKSIDKINKVLDEVNDYERDILYPLAGQNKEIDLDAGVKANYPEFGAALKKIPGLS